MEWPREGHLLRFRGLGGWIEDYCRLLFYSCFLTEKVSHFDLWGLATLSQELLHFEAGGFFLGLGVRSSFMIIK